MNTTPLIDAQPQHIGIDISLITQKIIERKQFGLTFQGFIGEGEIICHAVDPSTGKISGMMLPLTEDELQRSVPEWLYYETNDTRIQSKPFFKLRYTGGEYIYTNERGQEFRVKEISELPEEVVSKLTEIQEKTIPNNAFNAYEDLIA